jgi:hypothetical protein
MESLNKINGIVSENWRIRGERLQIKGKKSAKTGKEGGRMVKNE